MKRMRPIGLPSSALLATTRYEPSGSRSARSSRLSMSPSRIGALVAAGRRELRAVADDELLAAHVRDVVLRHVVAERPHQLRHRHFGPGRHRAVARRIELQEPALAGRVLHREARRHAVALRRGDRPRARSPGRRSCRDRRHTSSGVSGAMAGAVGEPARVGHLVHGVQVLRADVGTTAARP